MAAVGPPFFFLLKLGTQSDNQIASRQRRYVFQHRSRQANVLVEQSLPDDEPRHIMGAVAPGVGQVGIQLRVSGRFGRLECGKAILLLRVQ